MCRWFAYISATEPCLLEEVLILPEHALAKQPLERYIPTLTHHTHQTGQDLAAEEREKDLRNALYNIDGLGIAWYTNARSEYVAECTGPRPAVYKVLRQPMTDPVFRSICSHTSTNAAFGHIRAASGETAISVFNCHPFPFGRWTFMHNGGVAHFNRIKKEVVKMISDEALDLVKGTTDTEHLAALFFTNLEETKGARSWEETHSLHEVKVTLETTITQIFEIQRRVLAPNIPEPSSLNIAITDGEQLLTIRFRNDPDPLQHPPSLYISTTAGVAMNRKFPGHPDKEGANNGGGALKLVEEHGDHVIVASEPTTFNLDDWRLIPKNKCIMVGRDMSVHETDVNVQF